MTSVFPLSADVTTASFFFSFAFIVCIVLHSVCVLWENLLLFCRWSCVMQVDLFSVVWSICSGQGVYGGFGFQRDIG